MEHAEIGDPSQILRDMFPDPERPAWEQFFSERHRQLYAGRPSDESGAEVFRIFQRANFSCLSMDDGFRQPLDSFLDPNNAIPQLLYERLLPALALATRLIKVTRLFFCIIAFGKFGYFDDDGIWGYDRDEEGNWLFDLEEGADLDSKFQEFFSRMSNIQIFTGKFPENIDSAFGHSLEDIDFEFGHIYSHFYPPPGQAGKRMATAAVQMNTRWMTFFSRPDYDDISADVKNKLLVVFAVTLVHELVHVCYAYRRFEYARQGNINWWVALATQGQKGALQTESYFFGDETYAELGHAWERYAFNGEAWFDIVKGSCFSRSSSMMLIPYAREGMIAQDMPPSVRVIDPRLFTAFLSKDCWDVFDKTEAHPNRYEHVETLDLFEKMGRSFARQVFTEVIGRSPSTTELEQHLANFGFIVTRSPVDRHQSAFQWQLPPTPPENPPAEQNKPSTTASRRTWTDILWYLGGELVAVINVD